MGNNSDKAVPIAIIKNPNYKVHQIDNYKLFFKDQSKIVCALYDDFDQFIQKQSLKSLHNIVIVEGYNQRAKQKSQQSSQYAQYIMPIEKVLNTSHQREQKTTRQKVINYMKKYSVQYINLYIYVKEFNDFIIPQSQMSYITMVSTKSQNIMHHILNEERQKLASIKFNRLMKDLFRKKLVAVISKDYKNKKKQKDKEKKIQKVEANEESNKKVSSQKRKQGEANNKEALLDEMLKIFKQYKFDYLFFDSVEKFSDKLKSNYFQFIIAIDPDSILQLIQFKKKMPIQSKIIYFGKKDQLKTYGNQSEQHDVMYQRKLKQIWWCCNNMKQQIAPVMKKWNNAKTQNQDNDKKASNIVIYLSKCQNIIRKYQIQQKICSEIQRTCFQAKKAQDLKLSQFQKKLNLTIEYKLQAIYKRSKQDLYTNVVMFDASREEFESMKKHIMAWTQGEARVQVSIVQLSEQQNIESKQDDFQQRIKLISKLQIFDLKLQVSPLERITAINMGPNELDYFQNKMGLKVNNILTKVKNNQTKVNPKTLQNYFFKKTKIKKKNDHSDGKDQTIEQDFSQEQKFELESIFQNFLIICSYEDYMKMLFPYLVLANLQNIEGQNVQNISSLQKIKIQNYIKKIKVIIYGQIQLHVKADDVNQYSLNKFLNIHHLNNQKLRKRSIKSAIYNFFGLQEINKIRNNDSEEIRKKCQQFLQKIYNDYKASDQIENNSGSNNTKIRFPNIEFVHYRLSQIQNFLNYCKYSRLSFATFPKGSLKAFHQANTKNQQILNSRSFNIDAIFISSNNLLKEVFEKKKIQISSRYRMQFVKFSLSKVVEIMGFEDYVMKFTGLWRLNYDLFAKKTISKKQVEMIAQNLNILKEDMIRAFRKCKNYDLLKITANQFKHFYVDKIAKCKTILDLQIAAIYIYSLPHGISEVVNAIFEQPTKATLSIDIFCGFLFALFLNFISFECSVMEKVMGVIYVDESQIKGLYNYLKENEIIFNKNMLHLLKNENNSQNEKNHCIFINYEKLPLMKNSNISSILKIERFAFYKESAQFLLAPFTKLKFYKKEIVNDKYNLYFEVVQEPKVNIFLKGFFTLNNVNDIALFKALNEEINEKKEDDLDGNKQVAGNNNPVGKLQLEVKKVDNKTQLNNPTMKKQEKDLISGAKALNDKSRQTKNQQSLYRQAQEMTLNEEKKNVKASINLSLSYMKMIQSLKNNKLFSAEKYCTEIYTKSINQKKDNMEEYKKYEQMKEQLEFQKLRIEKSMLFIKKRQLTKGIRELQAFEEFIKYQKIEDKDGWLLDKIQQSRNKILRMKQKRQSEIQTIQPVIKCQITMDLKKQKQNRRLQCKMQVNSHKWKVKYDEQKQTFIMEDPQRIKHYNVFKDCMFTTSDQKPSTQTEQEKQESTLGDIFKGLGVVQGTKMKEKLEGKGIIVSRQPTIFRKFFDSLRKHKTLPLKALSLFITFYSLILQQNTQKKDKQQELICKTLCQIPQTYILEKFCNYLTFQFQEIKKNTNKNNKSYEIFLQILEKQINPKVIRNTREQLLYQYSQINIYKRNFIDERESQCWINSMFEKQDKTCRVKWSVFQFQNKLKLIQGKRKWKQKLDKITMKTNVFYRAENQFIQNEKFKHSQI